MRHPSFAFLVLALAGPFFPASAQQPQPLGRPLLEYAEPFSTVTGFRELSDGRVIVSDTREKLIQLIDLRSGRATPISREGSGPTEYSIAGALFPLPNDQTLLIDFGNQRFLRIGADGKPIETISPPQLPTAAPAGGNTQIPAQAAGMLGRLFNPRAVDAQGRLYFQANVYNFGDTPPPDSVPIVRWTIGQTRVDSVGWVRIPPSAAPTVTRAGSATMVMARVGGGGSMVWAPAETWQVAPDGRIARVTPEPYQVTWFGTTSRATAGPAVAYTPIRVTEADKEAYRERMRTAPRQMITMGSAGVASRSTGGPTVSMPEVTFAETMPPFWEQTSVRTSPDGEVWVLRTRPARDRVPVYDVFDASGRLARKVALPADTRLVGFGKESVYLVRRDADDLEYLQKYTRPAVGQP